MTTLDAIILGAIQGLTEFLPVSSSGHLVLAGALLGYEASEDPGLLAFEVLLHLGSLLAIVIVFWRDVLKLVYPRLDWHGIALLFVASLPAAIAGIIIKVLLPHSAEAWVEQQVLSSPLVAACGLLLTAAVLWVAEIKREAVITFDSARGPAFWTALWVGLAQMVAILPGVSRSGSTIATALSLKWVRPEAVKLSFLMGLIAIGGAGLIKSRDIKGLAEADPLPVLAGFLASLVFSIVGLTAIRFIVAKSKLRWFSAYCALAGVAALTWLALSR